MLRLSLPNIDDAAVAAAADVLRSGQLVYGAQGQAFERELEEWLGCRHAVVVSSGTAALHLALLALDIGKGDAVLVPNFTFPATANVVLLTGARPVLVDVDPTTYCITPDTLAAALKAWQGPERIRAVMPVHEFGHPVDVSALNGIVAQHDLTVVEDAACAIGAAIAGKMVGTVGTIGCYSFHPRKTLTTGEGGLLATDDDAIARRLRRLRNHGMERGSAGMQFHEAGLNYRLTDFQSALGRVQLRSLQQWIGMRRHLAQTYKRAMQPLLSRRLLTLPADHPGHSWQTFMVVLADDVDRDVVIKRLAESGVEANLGAQCLTAQPPFAAFGSMQGGTSLRLFRQGLALPFCERYGAGEVEKTVAALERAIG